jgi:protein-disulfide isomerase
MGVQQHGNLLGDPAAPVTLTEFSDLRCSHCKEFAERTFPILLERYVRPGKVRIVFENFPILGPSSTLAARMAIALGMQGHEFDFIDAFFHVPNPLIVSDDMLRRIASQIPGVDVEQAIARRDSPAVMTALDQVRTLAEQLGVEGTPMFVLGKTGGKTRLLLDARASKPETITEPIDELLAQK